MIYLLVLNVYKYIVVFLISQALLLHFRLSGNLLLADLDTMEMCSPIPLTNFDPNYASYNVP